MQHSKQTIDSLSAENDELQRKNTTMQTQINADNDQKRTLQQNMQVLEQ